MLCPKQYPYSAIDDAWKNAVLYDEHTWGAYTWDAPESDFVKSQWAIEAHSRWTRSSRRKRFALMH